MSAELWLRKPCEHGKLEWHKTFGRTWENGTCPGGSEERLDPERVLAAVLARQHASESTLLTLFVDVPVQQILDVLEGRDEPA